jgi:hypothetical protein
VDISNPTYGVSGNTSTNTPSIPSNPLQPPKEPVAAPESSKPPPPNEEFNISFPKTDIQEISTTYDTPDGK